VSPAAGLQRNDCRCREEQGRAYRKQVDGAVVSEKDSDDGSLHSFSWKDVLVAVVSSSDIEGFKPESDAATEEGTRGDGEVPNVHPSELVDTQLFKHSGAPCGSFQSSSGQCCKSEP
jgi:hypothetical protein